MIKHQAMLATIVTSFAVLLISALACSSKATPTPPPQPTAVSQPTATSQPAPSPVATATPAPQNTPTPTTNPGNQPVYGGVLRQALPLSMKKINPFHQTDYREQQVDFLIYESLVQTQPDFTIVPQLAKSWDVSSDGLTLTFHLQQGVTFQDGTPFNATAVKWVFDKAMDPNYFAPTRTALQPAIDSVNVIDDYTVAIQLKKPWRPLLGELATSEFGFISPTAYNKYGDTNFDSNPVGTGPFILKSWSPGNEMTLVKNPNYWQKGKPYLDEISFMNATDRSVILAEVRTGEADLVDEVTGTELPLLQNNPNIKILPFQTRNWWSMFFQVNKPPFDNKDLREAIAYGLDRQKIVDVYLAGQGQPAYSNGNYWYGDPNYKPFQYDPTKAKQMLAQAGFPNGTTVPYTCDSSDTEIRLCEIIQSMLADVGIKAQIQPIDTVDYYPNINKGNCQWCKMAYYPRPDPDYVMRSTLYSTGFRTRVVGYSNPQVDQLIDEAAGIYDTAKAGPIYIQAQRIVFDDAVYTGLYYPKTFEVMSTKVQNFQWWTDTLLRLKDVWITK